MEIDGKEYQGHSLFEDLDDWEPPVCHCGWVHYEGPCQCDKPECIAARQSDKENWDKFHKEIAARNDVTVSVAPPVADTKAKGLCENCGEREGKWHWLGESDGSLAISHGWVQNYPWWCEVCCLKGKIAYAVEQAAKIPEYEKELAEILDAEVQKTSSSNRSDTVDW